MGAGWLTKSLGLASKEAPHDLHTLAPKILLTPHEHNISNLNQDNINQKPEAGLTAGLLPEGAGAGAGVGAGAAAGAGVAAGGRC